MVKLSTVLELVQELSDSDRSELAGMLKDERKDVIPVNAFAGKYSGLESLCVFLKDEKGMRFIDIAKLLKRSQVTVRITYHNAKKKKGKFKLTGIGIPINIFADRKKSVMKNLVSYLKDVEKKSFAEIAEMLGRNYKTVWTAYTR